MTEAQLPKFRWWQKLLLALALGAGLGLLIFWFLTTTIFWQQVGWRLVAAVQDRVNGQVSVSKISGNLVTGMVFHDVKISRPQGDLVKVTELEVSVSLLSFLRLQPVIRTLAFRQPEVFLRQDTDGSWNYANLIKPTPPPPFSHIHLSGLQIQNGRVQLDRPRQHQIFQDITSQLDLTIQAPGRPHQTLLINHGAVSLTAPSYPRLQADFALSSSGREIHFQNAAISLADIPVLFLHGKIDHLDAEPSLELNVEIPELSGPQLHRLWPPWPAGLSTQAALELRGPLNNLHLAGSGALQDCQWQLAGSRQISGAAQPEFKLNLTFQNLSEKLLAAFQAGSRPATGFTPWHGSLTVSGHDLPWPPDNLQARLEVRPFSWGPAKIEAATLTFTSARDAQNLAVQLQGNFGRLESHIGGRLLQPLISKAHLTGEIKISTVDFNPALLLGHKAPPGCLNLNLAGNFQMPPEFNWCQARLTAKLQASGQLQNYAFQEFSAHGTLEAGALHLNPARLQMHHLRAEAQGRLSPADADLKLTLDLLPPGPWPLLPPDLKGQFRSTGTLKGEWRSLAYQLDFQGKSLSWRQLALASLRGKTAGTASGETVRLSGFDILAQNLATPVGRLGQIHAIGQTQGPDLVFDLKMPKSQGQSGALSGTASWDQSSARIKIAKFQWGLPNFQVASAQPVTLSIAPGICEISPLRLHYQKAIISLSAKLTSQDVSLQAKLENLHFADIATFLPQLSVLKGVVNAQADIAGPARAPSLKAQLNVASGQIGTFAVTALQSNWLYQDNTLSLNGFIQEKPDKAKIAWQGSSPLFFSLLPWSWRLPENGLQLRLWSENLNLSLLAALIPGVAASEGPLNLQAQITGGLLHPQLSGSLRYGPGSFTIRPSGAPLAIEPGELRMQGNRLIVPHLIFHSGDGSGEITGGASLADLNLQDVQLNLKATNLLIIHREGSRAVANGQVSLKGSWPHLRTDGRLTVNDGQFRLAFFRPPVSSDIVLLPRAAPPPAPGSPVAATAGVVKNFLINLVIDIPSGVWLRDKDVNTEIEGQIKVLRQVNGPAYLGGSVKAKSGTFTVNNKVFNIEKAMLLFPGEPHKPILLDARAERTVDEYTLYVIATGPVENPRTRLDSNPPLPPRDQLSLLVFDHLADKMTREEYVSVTQKAMGILGSLTAQKLKTLLGGDLPLLGDVSPSTSQDGLGVGKKLGKDITVSYEHKLNPLPGEDLNQIRLDYKFNKHLSAETQIGRKNTGGDIFFNIDF